MPFDEDARRALLTNRARDKAEHLRDELSRFAGEVAADDQLHLSEAQRALGEYALRRAMESVQRMVENLEQAMKTAQQVAEGGGGDQDYEANGFGRA